MFVIRNFSPGISKIGYPFQVGKFLFQSQSYKMQRMWWTSRNKGIKMIFLKIFFKILYRWFYPKNSCIRNEKIPTNPYRKFGFPALVFTNIKLSGFKFFIAFVQFFCQLIWLPNFGFDDINILRNVFFKTFIQQRITRVFGNENGRFPTKLGKIFCKFQPTLHSRTSGRRPVISND